MDRYYKIAGLTVKMDTFGRTLKQAEPYLWDGEGTADIVIQSERDAVQAKNPNLSAAHCEYLASGGSFYKQLTTFDGMLLHASAVVVDGRAYLFSAPRKTGKSTHVQLWLDHFGDRACILNDDKPALRFIDGVWYAYGTPWCGKSGQNTNLQVPVAGIALIARGEENRIAPYTGAQAIRELLEQTVRPTNPKESFRLLELMDSLLSHVPVWKLYCNMDRSAATIAYDAMSGQKG